MLRSVKHRPVAWAAAGVRRVREQALTTFATAAAAIGDAANVAGGSRASVTATVGRSADAANVLGGVC